MSRAWKRKRFTAAHKLSLLRELGEAANRLGLDIALHLGAGPARRAEKPGRGGAARIFE